MCFRILRKYPEENPMEYTSKLIALIILVIFGAGLFLAGVVALLNDSDNNDWFILYKDGFLILSGSIATIMGYYFGSKDKAIKEADKRISTGDREADDYVIKNILSPSADRTGIRPQATDIQDPALEGMVPAVPGGDDE